MERLFHAPWSVWTLKTRGGAIIQTDNRSTTVESQCVRSAYKHVRNSLLTSSFLATQGIACPLSGVGP